jgi:dehydrogenase/reductase SDR family member 7B
MLRRGAGQIVAVSGAHGLVAPAYRSANAAAKHAVRGYYDALRAEVAADSVGVTVVYPGLMRTALGMHALQGDGAPAGEDPGGLDSSALDPDYVAQRVLTAVAAGREEVTVTQCSWRAKALLRALWPDQLFEQMAAAATAAGAIGSASSAATTREAFAAEPADAAAAV